METFNEQSAGGFAGGVETEKLKQQLAEKDEELKVVSIEIETLEEQARRGGSLVDALQGRGDEVEALQEELERARSEVGVMKDIVKQGEDLAQEVDRLKQLLAERAEQSNLTNIQLEPLNAQMRGDGGGGGAEGERQLKQHCKTDDAGGCEMKRIANLNLAEQVFTLKQENSKLSGDLRQKDELCRQMEIEAAAHLAGACAAGISALRAYYYVSSCSYCRAIYAAAQGDLATAAAAGAWRANEEVSLSPSLSLSLSF